MDEPLARLLIADDEYWVRENLRNLVDWGELRIELAEPAADGEEAVRRIEAERPDILITDINMPFVSGNDVIRFARERTPPVVVIALSGYSDFAFVRDALLCGAIDYILKPITRSALLAVLEKAVAALDARRTVEREKLDANEKLLHATSIVRDRELSALIAEDETVPEGVVSDLELRFAAFSLALVRLVRRRTSAGSPPIGTAAKELEIKTCLSRLVEGAVVFQNVYSRNEYILLSGLGPAELDRLCHEVPRRLAGQTDLRVSVAVSDSHFSFSETRAAYREARSALMVRSLAGESAVIRSGIARGVSLRERITPEQEKRLLVALQTRNKTLAREVMFDQIGLAACKRDNWLFAEVKRTAGYLAALIIHHADPGVTSRDVVTMENFTWLLDEALEDQDVSEMCSLLDQLLDEAIEEPGAGGTSSSMRGTVHAVQALIDEEYFTDLSLTALARRFRIDPSYLSKSFKQETGCNIMLAIAKKRIEKAKEYIQHGDSGRKDLSLADVSYLVGYEDYSYFNRVFRKIAGLSPSAYKGAVQRSEQR
ncbi:MAG TPA: response regulator [Spirochaetia bacterium]